MRESKGVYATKRDIRENLNREYQLYANKVVREAEDRRYDKETTHNVGCQFDSKRNNVTCTCRNVITPRQQEARYFSTTSKQIFRYHGSRSFTDIGVGSVKALQRKKVRKIYLPETDDRGVGSSDLSTFVVRKVKNNKEHSFYEQKKTSSKCVGGVLKYSYDVMNAKLSPIIQIRSGTTNTDDVLVTTMEEKKFQIELKKTEIGNNTAETKFVTASTQVEVIQEKKSVGTKLDLSNDIVSTKTIKEIATNIHTMETIKHVDKQSKESTIPQTESAISPASKTLKEIKKAETRFSSDSLVQRVHNLENPREEEHTRLFIDPMENKLEREYRKIFSIKTKEPKSSEEKLLDDFKSTSLLKRRFEALRRSLAKKEDSKKNLEIAIEHNQIPNVSSKKDVSITSDPPSLEGRSYSNTKIYSPYSSSYKQPFISKPKSSYLNKRDSIDEDEAERQGVKGMFKLWSKKFNLEDDTSNFLPETSNETSKKYETKKKISKIDVKNDEKKGKKFSFFKKKVSKLKEPFKPKKGVTTGRCEVRDGLTINFGGISVSTPKPSKKSVRIKDDSQEIIRKAWLKKFMSNSVESRESVKIRWNNSMYATSSSTILEIIDHIYKQTGVVITSRSEMTSSYRSDETSFNSSDRHVNFFQQDIEAWMVPQTIPDRATFFPLIRGNSQHMGNKNNMKDRISDQKCSIDKSKAFAHKIEVILHSRNDPKVSNKPTSEYLQIDIPKDFFSDMSSDDGRLEKPSEEEVYKIVEYETSDSISNTKTKNAKRRDTGDHLNDNIKFSISLKDSKDFESNILETVIKKPPVQRDVVVQGSNVHIPKRFDVIGVGIITQRDIREIRKPILKFREEITTSDDSEERNLRKNSKKCAFAESFLHDYYRHWVPLGTDLFSWCVSDPHLQCSENDSHASYNNQGDGCKSCPNIYDDYQTSVVPSSCDGSPCSSPEPHQNNNFLSKLKKKTKNEKETFKIDDGAKRVLPKDSLEVFKRRKVYAMSNKGNWNSDGSSGDKPYSIPSNEDKEAQKSEAPKRMLSKKCPKRVLMKDDTKGTPTKKAGNTLEGILAYKGSSGCELCKNKKSPCPNHSQRARVDPVTVDEIKDPECTELCKKTKKPMCSKPNAPSCFSPPKKESSSSHQASAASPAEGSPKCYSESPPKTPTCPPFPRKLSSKPLCYLKPLPFPPIPNAQPTKCPPSGKSSPSKSLNSPPNCISCPPCQNATLGDDDVGHCNLSSSLARCSTTVNSSQKQTRLSPPKKLCPCPRSPVKSMSPRSPIKCTPPKSPVKCTPPLSPTKCTPKPCQKSPPKSSTPSACTSQDCKNPVCKREARKRKDEKSKNKKEKKEKVRCAVPPCINLPPKPTPPPPKTEPCSPDCNVKTPCQACSSPRWRRVPPCDPCSEQNSQQLPGPAKNNSRQPSPQNSSGDNAPTVSKDIEREEQITSPSKCASQLSLLLKKLKGEERECKPDCANKKKVQELLNKKEDKVEEIQGVCPPKSAVSNKKVCPETCKTKPRYMGIKLVKIPSKKTCSDDCLSWGEENPEEYRNNIIRLNSKENISISMKKQTPSTEEIRKGMGFKIQDEDGKTLLERNNYKTKEHCFNTERKTSILGDMYKDSNVRTVSTPLPVKSSEKNKNIMIKRNSDVSLANLVEINFTLKVTQGEKTTEINISKDDDKCKKSKNQNSPKSAQQVFAFKEQDGSNLTDNINSNKNDVNIRIVIKNYKANSEKIITNKYEPQKVPSNQAFQEFSEKISNKFHTVSTCYSNVLIDSANNIFPVHRATINLTSSVNKSKLINKPSIQLISEQFTETEPINLILSSTSAVLLAETKQSKLNRSESNEEKYTISKIETEFSKVDYEKEYEDNKSQSLTSERDTIISNFQNSFNDENNCGMNSPCISTEIKEIENKGNQDESSNNSQTNIVVTDTIISDIENSQSNENYDITSKPRNLTEKKEMLKKVFESANEINKSNNKEGMKHLRSILKVILTSDSSEEEAKVVTSNDILKSCRYESPKPDFFKNSDSINNHEPDAVEKDSMIKSDNISFLSKEYSRQSYIEFLEDTMKPQGCLCRFLAAKLNMCQPDVDGCCCKMSRKKSEETNCDLRTEDDLSLLNFRTEYVSVETQNSRYMSSKMNSVNISIQSATLASFNDVPQIDAYQKETFNSEQSHEKGITEQTSRHDNEEYYRKSIDNAITIFHEDREVIENNIPNVSTKKNKDNKPKEGNIATRIRNKWKRKENILDSIQPVDILQCYETKKAVLEIYAEKKFSETGEHLVAKLPKFVERSFAMEYL